MEWTDRGGASGSKSPRDARGAPAGQPERRPTPGPQPEGDVATGTGAANDAAPGGAPDEAANAADPTNSGDPTGAGDPTNGAAKVAELGPDELLAEARRERDEYLELAQRSRAEFENFRRRAAEESRVAETRGRAAVAKGLIGGLDNLERALQAADIDPDASEPAGEQGALDHGVALVYRELRSTLTNAGVESFDPTGERFDPTLHEAIATRPDEGASGIVVETVHKGYRLDGQLLRAAGVLVSE